MSNEMIERLASKVIPCDCCRECRINTVRNIIEAMKEPTEAMLDAGAYDLDMTLEQQWKKMIEAALKDG
jgi:hypothetical protein